MPVILAALTLLTALMVYSDFQSAIRSGLVVNAEDSERLHVGCEFIV